LIVVATPDGEEEHIETDFRPSGLGWLPDGSLLVVSMKDHRVMRREDGAFAIHADVTEHCGGDLNDLVVDAAGRAYVGNFGFDLMADAAPAPAALLRIDPDGTATVAAEDLLFPNGAVITPDGRTLIVGETFGGRYTAFTIGDDGSLSERRVWGAMSPDAGGAASVADAMAQGGVAPDGCALDAEGKIWAADGLGARCVRIAEGGEIVEEIKMPEGLGVFACMLGGDDGCTLLMCAAPDFLEHNRANTREAVLLTTTVDAPHAGLP
jgi:sugar lactone lactonase YvrE